MYVQIFVLCLVAIASVSAAPSDRIIGGDNAPDGAYPYQISMQYGYFFSHWHVCGGTILNEKWVLTSGYCITENTNFLWASFYVVAGINNLNDENGQTIYVKRTIVHPDYQGGVNPNDIGLLELSDELQFNDKVAPANLPAADMIPSGDSILSGWGSTSTTDKPIYPEDLQHLTVPIMNLEECEIELIGATGGSGTLADTNMCTEPIIGGTSACMGDAGGPVVLKLGDDFQVVGIMSWILEPCGLVGAPSVHTRVSAFTNFIYQYIGD